MAVTDPGTGNARRLRENKELSAYLAGQLPPARVRAIEEQAKVDDELRAKIDLVRDLLGLTESAQERRNDERPDRPAV